MFEYIMKNVEWMFSGVGVPLGKAVWSVLVRRRGESLPGTANDALHAPPIELPDSEPEPQSEESEVKRIAKRFRTILDLMNEGRHSNKLTISQLAKAMVLDRVGELEDVFTGRAEPSFQFLEKFCKTFGVNFEWLVHGQVSPFSNAEPTKYDPLSYLDEILALHPLRVYFVRENTETAPAFILLELSTWKFKTLHRTWHVSDHVGAGGESQLLGLYRLINRLRNEGYCGRCGGLTLDRDDFAALFGGDRYAGQYVDNRRVEDPWLDDLTDVDHQYSVADGYEIYHGRSFIKAQEIIRRGLKGSKAVHPGQ